MTWKSFHRRGEILRDVIASANRRRDGVLPMDVPGVAETFGDQLTLLGALQLRWHTRLAGRIERELMHQPMDLESAVVDAWHATADELPGVRAILDRQRAEPSTPDIAGRWPSPPPRSALMLAMMAGRVSAPGRSGRAVGAEIERRAAIGGLICHDSLLGDDGAMSELRAGMLLVATPALLDPNFADTVVLLLDVDDHGALGVVLNRPSGVPVGAVLDGWGAVVDEPEVLFQGGPVGADGALAVGLLSDVDDVPVGFRPVEGALGMLDLDTPVELLEGSLVRAADLCRVRRMGRRAAEGGDRGGQLVRRPRRGRRCLPGRPERPVARRPAPPARRARVALDPAAGPGAELSATIHHLRAGGWEIGVPELQWGP